MTGDTFVLHPCLQDVLEDAIATITEGGMEGVGDTVTGCGVDPQQFLAKVINSYVNRYLNDSFSNPEYMHELWEECVEDNIPDDGLPDCDF